MGEEGVKGWGGAVLYDRRVVCAVLCMPCRLVKAESVVLARGLCGTGVVPPPPPPHTHPPLHEPHSSAIPPERRLPQVVLLSQRDPGQHRMLP